MAIIFLFSEAPDGSHPEPAARRQAGTFEPMSRVIGVLVLAALSFVWSACGGDAEPAPSAASAAETSATPSDPSDPTGPRAADTVAPIESTGADELRDLVRPGDPAAAFCLADLGFAPGEFYDKDSDQLVFPQETHYFEARYDDGSVVEIRIHPDLVVDRTAARQAERIARPISLLPTELRRDIERVGFLAGESTAQADGGGEGIHVYEGNVTTRENANRFEETMFHESVHTSLDDAHAASVDWLEAREADGAFLTEYATSNPETEDLAETSLYAWALLHHPDRISEADAAAWRSTVPHRIAVVETILSAPGSGYTPAEPTC